MKRGRFVLLVAALPAIATLAGAGCLVVGHHLLESVETHVGGAFSVSFSPDGSRLVSGGRFDDLKLWEYGAVERRFGLRRPSVVLGPASRGEFQDLISPGEAMPLFDCLEYSHDGSRLLAGSARGCWRLFDLTGRRPRVLWEVEGREWIHWAAFSRESEEIVLATEDSARVLDSRTGAVLRTLPAHGPLVVARDGRRVVAVTSKHELAWIDPVVGVVEVHALVDPPPGRWHSITLLGDDRLCLVASFRALRLHDVATGTLVRSFEAELHFPRVVGSPDGRLAILLEEGDPMGMGPTRGDRTVVLDMRTGETHPLPASVLRGERVFAAAFAPDGLRLAIGTESGRVVCVDEDALLG